MYTDPDGRNPLLIAWAGCELIGLTDTALALNDAANFAEYHIPLKEQKDRLKRKLEEHVGEKTCDGGNDHKDAFDAIMKAEDQISRNQKYSSTLVNPTRGMWIMGACAGIAAFL